MLIFIVLWILSLPQIRVGSVQDPVEEHSMKGSPTRTLPTIHDTEAEVTDPLVDISIVPLSSVGNVSQNTENIKYALYK